MVFLNKLLGARRECNLSKSAFKITFLNVITYLAKIRDSQHLQGVLLLKCKYVHVQQIRYQQSIKLTLQLGLKALLTKSGCAAVSVVFVDSGLM